MRKINLLIISLATLVTSCNYMQVPKPETKEPMSAPQIIGGDKDAYGCMIGAGFTWSIAKNSCVRIWEVGTRLEALGDSKPINYIIIKGDNFFELFGENANVILKPFINYNSTNYYIDENKTFCLKNAIDINGKTSDNQYILYKTDKTHDCDYEAVGILNSNK